MSTKEALVNFWKENKIITDKLLLDAFYDLPREYFLLHLNSNVAYEDYPLPTVRGQSISQPTTTMLMTQALEVKQDMKILEVGAGVGYHASLLGKIVGEKGKIYSLEILPELVNIAKQNIKRLNLSNITILEADGSRGLPEEAPFDRIIITAACPQIPEPLLNQLVDGGIIVAPVGNKESQLLLKVRKRGAKLENEFLGSFMFVPLQGKYGFPLEDQIDVK